MDKGGIHIPRGILSPPFLKNEWTSQRFINRSIEWNLETPPPLDLPPPKPLPPWPFRPPPLNPSHLGTTPPPLDPHPLPLLCTVLGSIPRAGPPILIEFNLIDTNSHTEFGDFPLYFRFGKDGLHSPLSNKRKVIMDILQLQIWQGSNVKTPTLSPKSKNAIFPILVGGGGSVCVKSGVNVQILTTFCSCTEMLRASQIVSVWRLIKSRRFPRIYITNNLSKINLSKNQLRSSSWKLSKILVTSATCWQCFLVKFGHFD